jgi:hypothetical protein
MEELAAIVMDEVLSKKKDLSAFIRSRIRVV